MVSECWRADNTCGQLTGLERHKGQVLDRRNRCSEMATAYSARVTAILWCPCVDSRLRYQVGADPYSLVVQAPMEVHNQSDAMLVAFRSKKMPLMEVPDSAFGIHLEDDPVKNCCSCIGSLQDDGACYS